MVETYVVGLLERLCKVAKQRMDVNRRSSKVVVTSDMRRHVLAMQRRDQERERQRLLQAEKQRKDQVRCFPLLGSGQAKAWNPKPRNDTLIPAEPLTCRA